MNTTITINGEPHTLPTKTTLRDIITHITGHTITPEGRTPTGTSLGIAIALNNEIIPRNNWATTIPGPNARIEIVTAVQGG
ncbi:sulfur carrier protein ThiS [Dermatophilus congolensis]|uniref:sulfur carrier protein ThiS n=1 Tax=Dermatophilus congolensis TaxID=1863 RepID=UPI001AAF6CFE|nr:sulfur carrier protein ThiS [Dermatophilus congolensis]MBO3152989.1 sulfur carrier protein ThiS [Dermatophilus congolensis]MBO3159999.1 sulfur carrier protein ThiS [Dermatophilus congolensis]MBO3177822.1 sulfur carrier protein ThiS [Dermatophilus congolensis]MBO3200563.1 sulfur carrier protein ThiS [Dermatophilus congolensis]MBO3216399.1 sulfur carrier protein ThiS [Dermatophilus congolensis]